MLVWMNSCPRNTIKHRNNIWAEKKMKEIEKEKVLYFLKTWRFSSKKMQNFPMQ